MSNREQKVLAWLRDLGSGFFTYREVAAATGMTRDQALIACMALADRGDVCYVQHMGHYCTDRYELRRA